jgi:hypothetical protein
VRVLVVYQQQAETQPMLEFAQRLRLTISKELGSQSSSTRKALDFDRFTGLEQSSPLTNYWPTSIAVRSRRRRAGRRAALEICRRPVGPRIA